jgi:hypothetical protein
MAIITRASDREREQMRRSALGSTQGPSDKEITEQGLPPDFFRGMVAPDDPSAPSFPFLRRMARDHMIAMGLHFISMDALSAPWWMDGDDARVQAYADKLIRPIYVDLMLAALRFLRFGFSDGARNFQTAQPNWTYYENGEAKKVWDNGGSIDAIVYKNIIALEPETSQIVWDSTGGFNGIRYDARYGSSSAFIINGQVTPQIDKIHAWWVTNDRMAEGGNPYGYPRIAHCAPIFWMYRWIWDLIGRGFENSFDPGPVVRFPSDNVSVGDDGTREEPVKTALRIGSRRRTGSTIAIPSDQYKDLQEKMTGVYKWAIEYPKADTNFDAVMEFIGYLEAAKLNGLYTPEQSLTEGRGASSSRNVAENFSDQRSTSQNMLLFQLHQFIVDSFVMPVVQMVFPLYQGELAIKSVGAGGAASDMLRQVFQLAGQQDYKRFGIDMRRLAEANNFPMLDPAEQQKELESAAAQASALTPPVEPTQGRRALVTQTGFNEMSYHRIEQRRSPVEFLARDGDFVARLPRIDAFADAVVVSHARDLRRSYEALMVHLARDLSSHVARQPDLSRPDAVVRSWVPDLEHLDADVRGMSRALECVVQRSAQVALDDAPVQDVHHWTDRRALESTASMGDQIREVAADVIAECFTSGSTARATALELRSTLSLLAQSSSAGHATLDAQRAYNHGVLSAGVGRVRFAQVVDGCPGHEHRHGDIKDVQSMLLESIEEPGCTMTVRLLPNAPDELKVRHECLESDQALYDRETATALIDLSVGRDDEARFLLALGEKFR